jgi:hypothetical protein
VPEVQEQRRLLPEVPEQRRLTRLAPPALLGKVAQMRSRAGLLCTIVVVALVGCGGSGSSGVTAAAYVRSICSAIRPFETDVQTRSSALNLSSIKNASQGRSALHAFLKAISDDTDRAVGKLKAAGTPKVTNGKAISAGIVKAFSQLRAALAQAADRAGSLPIGSPQAFKAAAQTLGAGVRSSMGSIDSSLSGLRSQELERAAAKEPACRAL